MSIKFKSIHKMAVKRKGGEKELNSLLSPVMTQKEFLKKDLTLIQETFNQFHKETKLPYTHLSRVMAYSMGENYEVTHIKSETNRFEKS